jgi:lipopolysaccharide transport protein LptA
VAGRSEGSTNGTVITSQTMTYDYGRRIAEFEGNVHVNDRKLEIKSDLLRVFFKQKDSIKAVSAIGNVRISGSRRKASCERAVYFVARGEVILMGDATIVEGGSHMNAQRITFWVDEDKLVAKRARLRIDAKEAPAGVQVSEDEQ